MIFDRNHAASFAANYPDKPSPLRHGLAGCSLLAMDRLLDLTRRLPASSIEYNAGDLTVGQDPDKTPMNGLSAEETVRRISECRSWIVLKNIEQDAAYERLLENGLTDVRAMLPGRIGPMFKKEGFVFISSPGAVTPFHMDPEHNILLQVAGRKTFRIYPQRETALVSPEQHEAFHTPGGHRNLAYREEFERFADVHELGPGDALYAPVKAPHWVKVGGEVSVSLSITWRSRRSDDEARLHRVNAWLRAHGRTPSLAGAAPLRDRAKILSHRLAARLALR